MFPQSDGIKKPILTTFVEHLMEEKKTQEVHFSYGGQKKSEMYLKVRTGFFIQQLSVFKLQNCLNKNSSWYYLIFLVPKCFVS